MNEGCLSSPGSETRPNFQPRTESPLVELRFGPASHFGDNSLHAIETAGTNMITEFNTHISDPAAIWSFSGVKKLTRGASAYDEYSTFPANASVADKAVLTTSALNNEGITAHRGHRARAGHG